MATVVITGGTGLIGTSLARKLLSLGFDVTILTRSSKRKTESVHGGGLTFAHWEPSGGIIDQNAIAHADHIIQLAGAGIADRRWTRKRKEEIIRSRVDACNLVADTLLKTPNRVQSVISSSAIGWYGPDPVVPNANPFTEDMPPAPDFLGEACRLWEQAAFRPREAGKRVVVLRTGIVFSENGGALPKFMRPLKMGIRPILGNGRQMISWVHLDDLLAMYVKAITDDTMEGVYNAVAPQPVSNSSLMKGLARSLGRRTIGIKVPAPVLKLVFGGVSVEVLKSVTVSCKKIQAAGFQFSYPGPDFHRA